MFPLLLLAGAAQAGEAPKVDWIWQVNLGRCSLRQQVDDRRLVEIAFTPANSSPTVTIYDRRAKKPSDGNLEGGSLAFTGGMAVNADIWISSDPSVGKGIAASTKDRDMLARFARASSVEISHPKFGTVKAPVRSAAAAVDALAECEKRKLSEWEIDADALHSLKSLPVPSKAFYKIFSTLDFPTDAAAYGVEGGVIARLGIGTDGKVETCKSLNPIPYKGFEESVCNVLRTKGKFEPAIGSDGNPISAPYVLSVRFVGS